MSTPAPESRFWWDETRRAWLCDAWEGADFAPPIVVSDAEVESVRDEHFKRRCLCFDGNRGWRFEGSHKDALRLILDQRAKSNRTP